MNELIKTFKTQFDQTVRIYDTYAEVDIEWKGIIKCIKIAKHRVPHIKKFKCCYTQRIIKGKIKHCIGYINPENPKNSKPSLIKEFFGYDTNVIEVSPNYFDLTIYER